MKIILCQLGLTSETTSHSTEECLSASTGHTGEEGESSSLSASYEGTRSLSIGPLVECDIGKLQHLHTNFKQLSREVKYRLLTTEPCSDPSSYPRTRPYPSSSLRQFHPSWLKQHPWLHYSRFVDGAFCRACVVFAPTQVGGHDTGQFVTAPFKGWTATSGKADKHAKTVYHQNAMHEMETFLSGYKNPSSCVDILLDKTAEETLEKNQKSSNHCFELLFSVVSKVLLYVDTEMMGYSGMMMMEVSMKEILFNWFDFVQKRTPSLLLI